MENRNFFYVKTKRIPFVVINTAGTFINIDACGGAIKYETSGPVSLFSVFGWKLYKRAGRAFYLFGLVFNSIKNGKRSIVRVAY